jgi:DNA-binding HxlR family transcriptional regulator
VARRYDLKCPIARALDVIGDRWTILILRELFLRGPQRFHDFEVAFPRLAATVLSARLKDLEANGVVSSRLYEDHPPRMEYLLTPKGRALGPVLKALKTWGENYA